MVIVNQAVITVQGRASVISLTAFGRGWQLAIGQHPVTSNPVTILKMEPLFQFLQSR